MTADELVKQAPGRIVGIDEDLNVYGGHDETFHCASNEHRPEWVEPEDWVRMAKAERIALADYMIARWQRYKAMAAGD